MEIRNRTRMELSGAPRPALRRALLPSIVLLLFLALPVAARCTLGSICAMRCGCCQQETGARLTAATCSRTDAPSVVAPAVESMASLHEPGSAATSTGTGLAGEPLVALSSSPAPPLPTSSQPAPCLFLLFASLLI